MDRRDAAGLLDRGRCRLELLGGAPDERHLRTMLREQARDAGADTAAASGDERRLSGEEVRGEDVGEHEVLSLPEWSLSPGVLSLPECSLSRSGLSHPTRSIDAMPMPKLSMITRTAATMAMVTVLFAVRVACATCCM